MGRQRFRRLGTQGVHTLLVRQEKIQIINIPSAIHAILDNVSCNLRMPVSYKDYQDISIQKQYPYGS